MKNQGFTLIELLITIIVLSIVATVGGIVIYEGFNSGIKAMDLIDASWQKRLVMQRMLNEIEDIRSKADVNISSNSQFTFTDISGNAITYSLSGNFLQRTVNGSAKNVADGLTSLVFSYYDVNNSITTTATSLRCIKISVVVTKMNSSQNFQSVVCPRNLLW